MSEEAKAITFESEADMPPMPMSLGTTLVNKTGSWRYLRPVYRDKTPPCNHNCPAGEDIVGYLASIREGDYERGLELIRQENPFPGVCGRVCPHPCESECNRSKFGGAMAIHALERFLADHTASKRHSVQAPKRAAPRRYDAEIAIIGSGPAGLSCAYQLARQGYGVTVFEALSVVGGMMRVGIPEYRLPREVLDREIAAIEEMGVEIKTGMRLGDNFQISDLEGYDAICIAVGLQKSRKLNIPGEKAEGVMPGLEFLKRVNLGEEVEIGPKVVIVGGGNTAIDSARSALRLLRMISDEPQVTTLYRRSREEMPAIESEVEEALSEGVEIRFLASPLEILAEDGHVSGLKCIEMRLGKPDESGRRRPIPIEGSEFTVEAETVITAIGQEADLSFLEVGGWGLEVERGKIAINEAGATSRPLIFAAGDVATPFGTVAHAVGSGKRAALAIERYLREEDLSGFPPLDEVIHVVPKDVDPTVVHFEDLNLAYFEEMERVELPQRPVEERIACFAEVNVGLEGEKALAEAERCFSCGTCDYCDNCLIFCPDVAISRADHRGYEVNYDYCKGCGVCAEECPRCAISIERE